MNTISGIDVRGNLVHIPLDNIPTIQIFGMDMNTLLYFKYRYDLAQGPFPISKEGIDKVFPKYEENYNV